MIKNLQEFRKWQISGRTYQPLELEDIESCTCSNCGQVFKGRYCPNCGQKSNVKRLEFMGAVKEFLPLVYNFDVKFLRTCLELCLRPGHMIRDYIVDRKRCSYNNPISMIFILVTILLVEQFIFYGTSEADRHLFDSSNIEGRLISHCGERLGAFFYSVCRLCNLIYQNMAVTTLLSMLIYVLPNKIAFRKTDLGCTLNLTEHFYVMVYIACIEFILSIVLLPYNYVCGESPHEGHTTCSFIIMWIVFKQFYQIGIRRSFRLTLYSAFLMVLLVAILVSIVVAVVLYFYGDISHDFSDIVE